jgi:Ca2+-binding RTX toxin-like protein
MNWKFPESDTDVTVIVPLGTTDSALIAPNVVVTSTQSSTVYGTGSGHQVEVYGTVANSSLGLAAIALGASAASSSGEFVHVEQSGFVVADAGFGVLIHASHSTVVNDGTIRSLAGIGVALDGSDASSHSTLINHGTIEGIDAVDRETVFSPAETISFKNYGLIKGESVAFGMYNNDESDPAKDLITNRGTMIGSISLYGGDDLYDGRGGKETGTIDAGLGNDRVYGGKEANAILGGDGDDTIMGGGGGDHLTGGTGADHFLYNTVADSPMAAKGHDVIIDFSHAEHDKIDLRAIDADTHQAKNQAFDFIGSGAFSHAAGELRFQQDSGETFVYADVNGDGKADLEIELAGKTALHAGDFML